MTWRGAVALVIAGLVAMGLAGSAAAEDVSAGVGFGEQPGVAAEEPTPGVDDAIRKKLVNTLTRQLGRLKPADGPKKSAEDFYVVATAELIAGAAEPAVTFQVHQGQASTAELLADFIAGMSETTPRSWQVMARFQGSAGADTARQQAETRYTQLTSYRETFQRELSKPSGCRGCRSR